MFTRAVKLVDDGDYKEHISLYDRWYHRWHDRAEERACQKSPRYKEIRDKRRDGGSANTLLFLSEEAGLTIEVWEEEQEIFWEVNRRPLLMRLHTLYTRGRDALKGTASSRKARRQRGKNGFSDSDTWSLHYYLADVISKSVAQLKEDSHGWPGEPMTPEEWDEILTKISSGFAGANRMYEYDTPKSEQEELKAQFDEAFDLLHTYFFHLWD